MDIAGQAGGIERNSFIGNLLVRIHFIVEMIWWTGLSPWELNSLFQVALHLPSKGGIDIDGAHGRVPSKRRTGDGGEGRVSDRVAVWWKLFSLYYSRA